jgi:hypothetical protein
VTVYIISITLTLDLLSVMLLWFLRPIDLRLITTVYRCSHNMTISATSCAATVVDSTITSQEMQRVNLHTTPKTHNMNTAIWSTDMSQAGSTARQCPNRSAQLSFVIPVRVIS